MSNFATREICIYTENIFYVNTIFISKWIKEGIWVLSEKEEFLQNNFNFFSALVGGV